MRIVIDERTFKQLLENCKDEDLAQYAKLKGSRLDADNCQLIDFCIQKEIDYRLKRLESLENKECAEAYELRALIHGLLCIQECFYSEVQ